MRLSCEFDRNTHYAKTQSEAKLTKLSDVDKTAPALAEKYGVPHFNDIDEFAVGQKAGKNVAQAIILATPTHTHVPLAKKILEIGLGILVEKPVAVTPESGRELLAACKGHENSVVMVGHHRRHNCYVRAIQKVIQDGKLGKIIAVNGGSWFIFDAPTPRAILMTLLSLDDAKI